MPDDCLQNCPWCSKYANDRDRLTNQANTLSSEDLPNLQAQATAALAPLQAAVTQAAAAQGQANANYVGGLNSLQAAQQQMVGLTGQLSAPAGAAGANVSTTPRPGWLEVNVGGRTIWTRDESTAKQIQGATAVAGLQGSIDQLQAQLNQLNAQLQAANTALANAQTQLNQAEAAWKQKLSDLEAKIADLRLQAARADAAYKKCCAACPGVVERARQTLAAALILGALGIISLLIGATLGSVTGPKVMATPSAGATTPATTGQGPTTSGTGVLGGSVHVTTEAPSPQGPTSQGSTTQGPTTQAPPGGYLVINVITGPGVNGPWEAVLQSGHNTFGTTTLMRNGAGTFTIPIEQPGITFGSIRLFTLVPNEQIPAGPLTGLFPYTAAPDSPSRTVGAQAPNGETAAGGTTAKPGSGTTGTHEAAAGGGPNWGWEGLGLGLLALGGGILTVGRRRPEYGVDAGEQDAPAPAEDVPQTQGAPPPTDDLTVDQVIDMLRDTDNEALIDRYLIQRKIEQERALGNEPPAPTEEAATEGVPPSETEATPPLPPTGSGPNDAEVARMSMGDKWSTVCYDAFNDPNLTTEMKEAVTGLKDPKVIATLFGTLVAFWLIGAVSAGLGYILGAAFLVYSFGKQFFEFLDIVSDVNKAETSSELQAVTTHLTHFIAQVGPDWVIQLSTMGIGKLRRMFKSANEPLPTKPGTVEVEGENPISKSRRPAEPAPTEPTERPLSKGAPPTLPKAPKAPPTKTRFRLDQAKDLVIEGVGRFMTKARLDRVANRTKLTVIARARFTDVMRKRFPNTKWFKSDLSAFTKGEIWAKGTAGVHSVIHEWVHAFTNPVFRSLESGSGGLYEGLTEMFAEDISAGKQVAVTPTAYTQTGWTAVARKFTNLVGSDFLKSRFFGDKGTLDFIEVGKRLQKVTGNPRAWQQLQQALQNDDIDACRRVLNVGVVK